MKKASWDFEDGDEVAPACYARKLLGGGNVFQSYLAWDERLQANIVCKLLRPDRVTDAGALRDLERESTLLARLDHPHVVKLREARLDAARPHLALQHTAGPSLRRRIRVKGALAPERAIEVGLQLASALAYLAVERVVHLDVKPANVILGPSTRLIDFSVARTVDNALRLRQAVGTTDYMAPEQSIPEARGGIGVAADVWGFGATLYEALTGRAPFARTPGDAPAPTGHSTVDDAKRGLPRSVPSGLAQLVCACLARSPEDRPTIAQALGMLQALQALSEPPR